jgi:PAS domain S-box-containing protein
MTDLQGPFVPPVFRQERNRILLADDDPANLRSLRSLIDDPCYSLVEARSLEDVVERIQVDEFVAILLDLQSTGIACFNAANAIRQHERSRHTPIVLMANLDIGPEQIEQGYALGAVDFLFKPVLPVALRSKIRGFVQLFQDRIRARNESEQLRLLVHGTTEYAIFMLDSQGRVITWNAGAQRFKGYQADEIIGQHFTRFYPQEAIDRGWPAYELEVATAEGRFEDEGWRVRKDGSQFWANVVITALKDDLGNLQGFSKITKDMTERKKSEENARRLIEESTARRVAEENSRQIQEQRERLRVTLSSIGDAVISTNSRGEVDFLNPVAQQLVGWDNQDAAGRSLADVFRIVNEVSRQPVENPALRALAEGTIVGLANHTVLISRDGTERPIDDCAAPIRDGSGQIVGSVLVFRDISEKKRNEAVLAAQKRVLELLVHGAPLADVLDAVCEAMERQAPDQIIATVLLADDAGQRVRFAAGRRLPTEYASAIDDIAIGPFLESRNTKGHSAGAMIVTDLASSPAWADRRDLANACSLQACWSTPILSSQGHVLGMFAVFFQTLRDPTEDERRLVDILVGTASVAIERRRDEAELRESERRFSQLADAMPQIVWTAGADGTIDYLNRRWTEFTGLPATAGNEGWKQILHPDDAPAAAESWARSLRSGDAFEREVRLLDRARQGYRWYLIRTVPIKDEAGKVARWFGTATDIDMQKQSEQSARYLSDASAALAGVLDYESTLQKVVKLAVPHFADWSAVDITGDDGTLRRLAVAHCDPQKVELAHELMRLYPPDPNSPNGPMEVLHSGKPLMIREITDDMLAQGAKDERHLNLMRSLGLKSYICVPLAVSGKITGVLTFATAESGRVYSDADLALATDLALRAAVAVENTQLYQALREADRRKDEFLATLAHELRNPLAPIRNSLQILKMPRIDSQIAQQTREMMERQVHHLVRLVDDLLDVSRVMRGKIDLRRETVELATIVARAVETVTPLIEAQRHRLETTVPPESLLLDADPVRLTQVVGNLLTNSAKYTEPGGLIELTVRRDNDVAVLAVRDNGIGIAGDMLPHVFELFAQADHATTKAQGGLGIGLTLVKNLVEMHGGSVMAHSNGLALGSEFTVRMPLLAQSPQRVENDAMSNKPLAPQSPGHRILIVDDNRDAAISLSMLLRLQGHDVKVTHNGASALEIAASFRPSVIFLDIGMPGMDGYEVARRVRATPGLEKTILAALTGWGQPEDRRRTTEAGFNHHLVKPLEPQAIEAVLAVVPN